ncbi:MAG: hypothetical protein H8K04_05330 [Nitrospira sp.]
MPGLFGVLTLNSSGSMSDDFAVDTLRIMANSLRHGNSTVLKTCVRSSHGLAIGRMSLPSTVNGLWPGDIQEPTLPSNLFVHGALFGDYSDAVSQTQRPDAFLNPEVFLRQLTGFYSLVMRDEALGTTIIAVDRRASEPIFYLQERGMIFFAPEVKALLSISSHPVELNAEAAPMFFSGGHLLGEQTMVSSVKRLPGGSYLKIEDEKLSHGSYWSFLPGSQSHGAGEGGLKEELKSLIKQSVVRNMGDPQKTAIFLSGGVDSRGILAGALDATEWQRHDLRTVSWGLDEGITGSDPNTARAISARFNLTHEFFPRLTAQYADHFQETNYIVDGLSDIAAFHPYELTIMRKIKESGYERVLRGDEIFGWHDRVYTYSQAETEVGLRPLGLLPLYSEIIAPKFYSLWCSASDAGMARIRSSIQGMEPNDAKDYLYFEHRLQGYLHTAAYYKQLYFDHRNVLLDDSILEFLARVPPQYRLDKGLFRKAVHELNPMLATIPIANRTGYENWGNELVSASSLREYTQNQLNDTQSGVWEYFDRPAVVKLFNALSLTSPSTASREQGKADYLKNRIRAGRNKALFACFPRYATELRASRLQRALLPYVVILRFLVFKNWHDRFVSKSGAPSSH